MTKFDPTKPVQTRGGRKARIICTDVNNPLYPVAALVTCRKTGKEFIHSYTEEGAYVIGVEDNLDDLINVPPPKVKIVRWINLTTNIKNHHTVFLFQTKADGQDAARMYAEGVYIDTVSIEWEEKEDQ